MKKGMKDKEKDKRLLVPGDAFEEEASEGLGRLSREEAEADLRELKGRMERRLRKPRMIWLPAAAAVVILLVASALYVSIFRDSSAGLTDLASAEEAKADSLLIAVAGEVKTDTALIAMATPIEKKGGLSGLSEMESRTHGDISTSDRNTARKTDAAGAGVLVTAEEADVSEEELRAVAEDARKEAKAEEVSEVVVVEAQHEEPMAEEVIVEVIPMMQKAAVRSDNTAKDKAVLRPDAARPAAAEKEAALPDRSALPVGGWEEYREWMASSIRYPEGVDPVERQVIVVTFRVRADSTVYDLKAERTPGDLFTREAFRLIREGPKWVPAIRNGQAIEEEVRISIVFK
jgi:hypothetical protein